MKPHNREAHSRHVLVGGNLAPGTDIGDGATVYQLVPLDDHIRGRFRAKLSAQAGGGTFSFIYPRPDASGEYLEDGSQVHADAAAVDLALADTNEDASADIDFYGEAFILLKYVDGGGGSTIEYVAFSGLS